MLATAPFLRAAATLSLHARCRCAPATYHMRRSHARERAPSSPVARALPASLYARRSLGGKTEAMSRHHDTRRHDTQRNDSRRCARTNSRRFPRKPVARERRFRESNKFPLVIPWNFMFRLTFFTSNFPCVSTFHDFPSFRIFSTYRFSYPISAESLSHFTNFTYLYRSFFLAHQSAFLPRLISLVQLPAFTPNSPRLLELVE